MKEVFDKLDQLKEAIHNSTCAVDRVAKWQEERRLDKRQFVAKDEFTNLVEEILEGMGFKKEGDKNVPRNMAAHYVEAWGMHVRGAKEEDIIDALFDLCVYAIGSMMKLKYVPGMVFQEGLKEIESRKGEWSDEAGKFVKDPTATTYKADYSKAKKEGAYD